MHRTKLRECINDYAAKIIRFGVFEVISARCWYQQNLLPIETIILIPRESSSVSLVPTLALQRWSCGVEADPQHHRQLPNCYLYNKIHLPASLW